MTQIPVVNGAVSAIAPHELTDIGDLSDTDLVLVARAGVIHKMPARKYNDYVLAGTSFPHLMDGLPPGVLFSAPTGAQILDGSYCDDTDLLTVSSGSKYVVGADGNLTLVPANTLAYDWSSGRRRLLIEATATNILTYGQTPGSIGWTASGTPGVVLGIDDPLGGATAARVTLPSGASIYRSGATTSVSVALARSLWLRRQTTTGIVTLRNAADVSRGYWQIDLSKMGHGYERITRDHAAVTVINEFFSTPAGAVGAQIGMDAGTPTIDIWADQIETGAISTSTILTPGNAAVTRIADDVRLSAAALAMVKAAGGCTIVMRGAVLKASTYDVFLGASGEGNEAALYVGPGLDPGIYTTGNLGTELGGGSVFSGFACAVTCNGSATRASNNGTAVVANAVSLIIPAHTAVRIGAYPSGWTPANIYLDELVFYPFVASDTALGAQSHAYGA